MYEKLKKNQQALQDANKALEILQTNRGSRSQLAKAHLRRGYVGLSLPAELIKRKLTRVFRISLYHSKKYDEAKKDLETSKEFNAGEKTLTTWMRKVDDELAKGKKDEESASGFVHTGSGIPKNLSVVAPQQPSAAVVEIKPAKEASQVSTSATLAQERARYVLYYTL